MVNIVSVLDYFLFFDKECVRLFDFLVVIKVIKIVQQFYFGWTIRISLWSISFFLFRSLVLLCCLRVLFTRWLVWFIFNGGCSLPLLIWKVISYFVIRILVMVSEKDDSLHDLLVFNSMAWLLLFELSND